MKKALTMMIISGLSIFLLCLLIHVFYNDFTIARITTIAIATAMGNFIAGIVISIMAGDFKYKN